MPFDDPVAFDHLRETVEDLGRGHFAAVAGVLRQIGEGFFVGDRAPQERGDVVLFNLLQAGGDPGLAEILLRDDVARDLAPIGGYVNTVEREDDRAIRVADFTLGLAEFNVRIWRLMGFGVTTFDPHFSPPVCAGKTRPLRPRLAPVFCLTWSPKLAGRSTVPSVRNGSGFLALQGVRVVRSIEQKNAPLSWQRQGLVVGLTA